MKAATIMTRTPRHPYARGNAVLFVKGTHNHTMTQSELWLAKWQEAIDFLETNHRKPSKFVPEERNMRLWWKHNKKLMNAGELKPKRVELFKQLLELGEKYKHVNQYQ